MEALTQPYYLASVKEIMELFIKKHIKLSFKKSEEVTEFYRSLQVNYPKFFKMDGLSKLGFAASEVLLKDEESRFIPREDIAIVCFNRSSSLDIDMQYQKTIRDNKNYFPSPSLFVYTLPNIIAGEIAIRNSFFGETFFYLCKNFDSNQIIRTVKNAFYDNTTNTILVAWIECFEKKREVFMILVEKEKNDMDFSEEQLEILYNKHTV